jgi:ribose 5-phosphate isomerase A
VSDDAVARLKREAAEAAAELIQSGMVVGLGTGSTSMWAVRRVAELLRDGRLEDVVAVPTSSETEAAMRELGVPVVTLEEHPTLDLTIDGADEVDLAFNLIKGGGGALLREKIVAQASAREVIVVDEGKLSPALGTRHPLPVEVIAFALRPEQRFLESLGAEVTLRHAGAAAYRTDEGNLILDCAFGPIADPAALSAQLHERAAIVEHGLFLGLTSDLFVASDAGVEHRDPGAAR